MKKIWAWILGMFISLLLLLRIVVHQRDKHIEKSRQSAAEAAAQRAIRESERRIAKMRYEAQFKAKQVQDELDEERASGDRPRRNFGDVRLHNRQD